MAEVFAVGWVLCVRRQTEHESVMLLLSLSSLNVLTRPTWSFQRIHYFTPKIQDGRDLCSGVCTVCSMTTRTRVSDATVVTFFVKCVNPLKLYPLSGNIFRMVCFRVFIYSQA